MFAAAETVVLLCVAASKVHAHLSRLGVSWHAVVWVLLAAFVNVYVAMLYLVLALAYKLCLHVIESVALARKRCDVDPWRPAV